MMDRNLAFKDFDEQIRKQLDVVTVLLASGKRNQESSQQALIALNNLRSQVVSELTSMREDVTKQITEAGEITAKEAARLLQAKFIDADQQAVAAAARYRNAGRWLSIKVFAVITLVLVIACIAAWLILAPMLPTAADMQKRRDEIVSMEAHVAALKKRGASLQWGTCGETGEWCFRTDGGAYGSQGDTYAIPYRKK
jgi:hypothetical protein